MSNASASATSGSLSPQQQQQRTAARMNALTMTFGMSSSSNSSSSPSTTAANIGAGASSTPIRVKVPSFLTVAPQLEVVRILRNNLENSLTHLQQTQRELEALVLADPGPDSQEYKDALSENKPIIARFFKQITEIQRLIVALTAHQGRGNTILFVPEEEWDATDEILATGAMQLTKEEEAEEEVEEDGGGAGGAGGAGGSSSSSSNGSSSTATTTTTTGTATTTSEAQGIYL